MLEDSYLKLPYDLSGSMSKNRFRNEMLWGLEKMFELYKTNQDFFMVFDYVCDIEAHLDGKIEFFQIKTNNAAKPYSITKIAKPDKSGKSILGKLYAIKTADDSEDGIVSKLAIVVNVPLKTSDNVTHSTDREISFDKIDEVSKRKIAEYLIKECNVQTVDLSDCYYLYTSMDLFNPHDSLLGKTINFFVDVYGEEPKRAKVLFQTMTDTIEMKACYEQRCINYDEVILKKGISRNELQKILEKHIDISDESIQIVKQEIKEIYPEFSVCTKMNAALVAVTKELRTNALFLKAGLEEELTDIEHKIELEEKKYQKQLEQINDYEKKLTAYNEEISDVLKYKGYMEMRDSLIKEIGELVSTENAYEDELKKEKRRRKKFDDSKKQVNQRYYELMTRDKQRFGLKEISDKKLMDIKSNISAGGSNKPIATIIWYMNLLRIKKEFNPNAILFPIVFDSPNNVETDNEKRIELLKYLFESVDTDTQLIISNLGFDRNQFKEANIEQIIEITNDKYQLLNQKDYDNYKGLFISLMENDI